MKAIVILTCLIYATGAVFSYLAVSEYISLLIEENSSKQAHIDYLLMDFEDPEEVEAILEELN